MTKFSKFHFYFSPSNGLLKRNCLKIVHTLSVRPVYGSVQKVTGRLICRNKIVSPNLADSEQETELFKIEFETGVFIFT